MSLLPRLGGAGHDLGPAAVGVVGEIGRVAAPLCTTATEAELDQLLHHLGHGGDALLPRPLSQSGTPINMDASSGSGYCESGRSTHNAGPGNLRPQRISFMRTLETERHRRRDHQSATASTLLVEDTRPGPPANNLASHLDPGESPQGRATRGAGGTARQFAGSAGGRLPRPAPGQRRRTHRALRLRRRRWASPTRRARSTRASLHAVDDARGGARQPRIPPHGFGAALHRGPCRQRAPAAHGHQHRRQRLRAGNHGG